MPLSQARFIALINAALDFKQAAERIIDSIEDSYNRFQSGHGTAEEHFHTLMSYTSLDNMLQHKESLAVLALEYHHFRRNARRNDRAAIKQALKRREAGAIPRSTISRTELLRNTPSLPIALQRPKISIDGNMSYEDRIRIVEEVNSKKYLDDPTGEPPMIDRSPDPFLPPPQADDPFSGPCPVCSQLIDDCSKPQCEWLTIPQKVPEGSNK